MGKQRTRVQARLKQTAYMLGPGVFLDLVQRDEDVAQRPDESEPTVAPKPITVRRTNRTRGRVLARPRRRRRLAFHR